MASAVAPRTRILAGAIACFTRSGFHGASMQEICAEAGMSPGALYRHFPSKVAIIAAIAEEERASHAAFFEQLAQADDPVEALASVGVDTLEDVLTGPVAALSAETLAEAIRNPEIRAICERSTREARDAVAGALRRGQSRGQVDPALDVETAVQLIMAMGDGLGAHRSLDPTLTVARFRPVLQLLLRRFLRPVAICLILATPLWAAPPMAEPKPPSITTVLARTGPIADTAQVTGTLVPREEVLVSPQLDGLATIEIRAEEGDHVAAGQVLARLAPEVLQASVAQNEAQVARAQAAIAQARSQVIEAQANRVQADQALARTRELVANGNASRESFEQRQAAAAGAAARQDASDNFLRVAAADLALATAQRREIDVRLARTEIRSPVAGIVSRRTARLGSVVSMAGDPLFRIIEDGAVELEADVPETLLARLRVGQDATVSASGGDRAGRVRLVSSEINRASRLGRVRVAIDGAPEGLVIGSFARAAIVTDRRDGVLIPLSAVLFDTDGAVVQVVRQGLVETRQVKVGLRTSALAQIESGVAEGEAVVGVSGTFVRGGDRVTAIQGR